MSDLRKRIAKVRKRLASGQVVEYHYAWRGGPRLAGEPGSAEYLRSLLAAHEANHEPQGDVFQAIVTGYRKSLAEDSDGKGEERLANLDELISAARDFDREHAGGTVVEFLEEISLASAVDRWKDGEGAVALMTFHAAKGLEFPVVFLVGLEQGLLPHVRSNRRGGRDDRPRLRLNARPATRERGRPRRGTWPPRARSRSRTGADRSPPRPRRHRR